MLIMRLKNEEEEERKKERNGRRQSCGRSGESLETDKKLCTYDGMSC